MNKGTLTFNLGKKGYTDNIILTLQNAFKTRESVKVVLLKSARKEDINNIAEKIISKLGKSYTYRVIGYTISLKKWRKFTKNAKNRAR
jgi:RNA-binding protein YhbY